MDAFREHPELAATAQHIELVTQKIKRLTQANEEAWAQILTRTAVMYNRGELTITDLWDLLRSMGETYDGSYTRVWNAYMPVKYGDVRGEIMRRQYAEESARRHAPNGPHGTWFGELPLIEPPYPLRGVSVVYVLFDAANKPIYVGSSFNFRARMNDHVKSKPEARRWVAYPCADREEAYRLEERLLAEHKLPLNRKASR